MSTDSYRIFVSLSHRRIAFEYWQRDGEDKLVAMPNGLWPAPLAFYCSESGIVIGEDAARAAHNGTENAFDNYFDILKEDKIYTIGGRTKPVRNLLLDACERVFRDFYKDVLFNRNGTLNDNRANMPLYIVCESDIKPNERAFLFGLFRDCGYARVDITEYDQYISQYISSYLSKDYIFNKVVVAWTEGKDLTFSLFDVRGVTKPISATYEGLGIDPRKEYVMKLIWDRVCGQNPWLAYQYEKEIETINKVAENFLRSSDSLVVDTIQLSDNQKYRYELNRNSIDCESNSDGVSIKAKLQEFLRSNGITNPGEVLLLLRGDAANNSYFETNLSYGFSKTIKSDQKLRNATMKLLIDQPTSQIVSESQREGYREENQPVEAHDTIPQHIQSPEILKQAKRNWREVRASAKGKVSNGFTDVARKILTDYYAECEPISGSEQILAEIRAEIDKLPKYSPPTPVDEEPKVDTSMIKELSKKWREVRASAKGKSSIGKVLEAKEILSRFAFVVSKVDGAQELLAQVESELAMLTDANKSNNISSSVTLKRSPKESIAEDGKKLIQLGKLKDARDWFREKCDTKLTQTLNAIIRSQRAVEMRKGNLDECRKTKNRDQIKRIIKELKDYVALCDQAGVDASDYKKLMSEYEKIK